MNVVNTLAPVVLLIALGAYLRFSGFMPERKAQWASRLTYWIALPALLFIESASARVEFSTSADLLAVLLVGMAASILAAYMSAMAMRVPRAATGSFVQAAFRGNLAFIGLPVVIYTLGEADRDGTALAVLMIAAIIPFYNTAAVLVLLAGQHSGQRRAAGVMLKQLIMNPLILACAAGLLVSWLGIILPVAILRTIDPLGRMALPLALLSIGVTLDVRKIQGALGPIIASSLVKVALAPMAGFLAGRIVGLSQQEMLIGLILLACPTASASFVTADLLKGDQHLTAGVIVLSTFMALPSLIAVTLLFG